MATEMPAIRSPVLGRRRFIRSVLPTLGQPHDLQPTPIGHGDGAIETAVHRSPRQWAPPSVRLTACRLGTAESSVAMVTTQELVDAIFERDDDFGLSLAMVVLHDGELIAERYGVQPETIFGPASGITADTPLPSWSTAKSITHAAVGLLVADGQLDLEAPAPVPDWQGSVKAQIRMLDLLEMRPGLRFIEDYVDGEVSHCIDMLFGDGASDHAAYAAAQPLDHPPGTVWNYSSGTTNILCRILGDVVAGPDATPPERQAAIETFLHSRLFEPCAMSSATPKFDTAGNWVGSSYVEATAIDFARFGELYRNDGVTPEGQRILPVGWADHGRALVAHDPAAPVPGGFDYGRHWWMWPEFPGSITAHGYEGQYIVVVPDHRLTLVHLGKTDALVRHHLIAALHDVIRAVS